MHNSTITTTASGPNGASGDPACRLAGRRHGAVSLPNGAATGRNADTRNGAGRSNGAHSNGALRRSSAAASRATKPLICALMTLALAAGVVLAVALPDPTPVAAATKTIRIVPVPGAGTEYKLTPESCTGATPAAQTAADKASASDSTANVHGLDNSCDWKVEFCDATIEVLSESSDGNDILQRHGSATPGSLTLTRSGGNLVWSGGTSFQTTAVEVLSLTSLSPCTQTINIRTSASSGGVTAGFDYTLTPENCSGVAGVAGSSFQATTQSRSDGTGPSVRDWKHKLSTACDWQVEFCHSPLVHVMNEEGTPIFIGPFAGITSGRFKLAKGSGKLTLPSPPARSGTQSGGTYNGTAFSEIPVNRIQYDDETPCLRTALHTDSDSETKGDNLTNDTTPKITVSNVTGGASVTVTATKGADLVTKTVTVGSSDTSVDVEFAGNTCGTGTGACGTLDDGEWVVTGTHTPSGSSSSDSLIGFTLTVDNTAPVIASITASPPLLTTSETSSVEFVFTDESDIIEFAASDVGITAATPANSSAATLASLTGSGQTFTATFSATTNDTYTLTVTDGMVKDAAGNTNAAPASTVSETIKVAATTTTEVQLTRNVARSDAEFGIVYTMTPQNCAPALVSALGVKTEADASLVSPATQNSKLELDVRCDWQIRLCGSFASVAPANGNSGEDFDLIRSGVVTLLKNPAMGRLEHAGRAAQSVYEVTALVLETSSDPSIRDDTGPAWTPCARVVVVPESGTVSARDASVEYTLTPSGCYTAIARVDPSPGGAVYEARELDSIRTSTFAAGLHVAAQTESDGLLDDATGGLHHLLAADCNWSVSFCQATVKLYDTTANPAVLRHTASRGAFTLNRSTATETITSPNLTDITRIKGELLYLNDISKPVDELRFSSAMECPPIALHDGSDSGLKGDRLTKDDTPTFTVSDVTGGSSVTVTATKGTDVVTKTATVGSSDTSVDVELSGVTCGDPAALVDCGTLADGDWVITGVETLSDGTTTETLAGITIKVDTEGPTVRITSDEADLTVVNNRDADITFETSEPTTDFALADITHNDAVATLGSFAATDADTYTATLTAAAAGTAKLSVPADKFHDAAGNPNQAPDTTADPVTGSLSMTVNPQPASQKPIVTLKDATSDTGFSATDGITKNTGPTFVVEVEDMVTNASLELKANKGVKTLSQHIASATGTSFEFDFSGSTCTEAQQANQSCALTEEGNWRITARLIEGGGKAATDSAPFTVHIDTTRPKISSITASPDSIGVNDSAWVEFVFSEPVTVATQGMVVSTRTDRFARSLVRVTTEDPNNGGAGTFGDTSGTAPGTTYLASLSSIVADTLTVSMPAHASVQDIAGNASAADTAVEEKVIVVAALPASDAPTLAYTGDDTGPNTSDMITADNTPEFTVSDVVAGSAVTIVATHEDGDVVLFTKSGVAGTSVDFDFADNSCGVGASANRDCDLADGTWTFKATHKETSHAGTDSAATVTLTIITAALKVIGGAAEGAASGVVYTLTPQDCPEGLTVTPETQTAASAIEEDGIPTHYLDSRCDWRMQFRSSNPVCTARLRMKGDFEHFTNYRIVDRVQFPVTDENGNTVTRTTGEYLVTNWYGLFAGPGETVELLLRGNSSETRLEYTTWHPTVLVDNSITEVAENRRVNHIKELQFVDCALAQNHVQVPVYDLSPSSVELTYQFKAVSCVGIGLPPAQGRADGFDEPGFAGVEDPQDSTKTIQDITHHLNLACVWEFSFSRADNCQVTTRVRRIGQTLAQATQDTSGLLVFDGNLPGPGESVKEVGLYLTTDSAAGKCASAITFSNTAAAGANKAVRVEFKPVMVADTEADCAPSDWAPGPARAPDGKRPVMLEAAATQVVTLADNCTWKLTFDPVNDDCSATVQLLGANDRPLGSAVLVDFGDDGGFNLVGGGAGLTHSPGGGGTGMVAHNVAIDVCGENQGAPANTAKMTIIDESAPHGFDSYELTAACSNPPGTLADLSQADAIVSGNEYVHYLDLRCFYTLRFSTETPCNTKVAAENAAGDEQDTSFAGTASINGAPSDNRFYTTSDTTKVIDKVRYTVGPTVSTNDCLTLVNVSTPLPIREDISPEVAQARLPATRGSKDTPLTEAVEFDRPFPKVLVDVVPHKNGADCSPGSNSFEVARGNIIELPAGVVDPDPEKLTFLPGSHSVALDKDCDWNIRFTSAAGMTDLGAGGRLCFDLLNTQGNPHGPFDCREVDPSSLVCFAKQLAENEDPATGFPLNPTSEGADCGPDGEELVCTSAARVLDTSGEQIGSWVAGSALVGGVFNLERDSSGLMYQNEVVGSVEFEGCLELDNPGTAPFQIYDDSGIAGDFSYTIQPSSCDGFVPPATQTKADGAVFEVAGIYQHQLHRDCDWEITFNSTSECEAAALWSFNDDGLEYVDSVLAADGATSVTVSLRQLQSAQLDEDTPQRSSQEAIQDGEVYDALRGFAYFPGGSLPDPYTGNAKGELAGSGLPDGNAPEADEAGGQPSGPGLDPGLSNLPASPRSLKAVNAISLECASVIEFSGIMGLESPGLQLKVATPTVAEPTQPADPANPSFSTTLSTCVTTQQRLADPGRTGYNVIADSIVLESGTKPFSLALNRKCDWKLSVGQTPGNTSCRAAVKVMSADTPPTELETKHQSNSNHFDMDLRAGTDGLMYTPTGGSPAAVGAIEFYNCFHPSVLLWVPAADSVTPQISQVEIRFNKVGSQAICGRVDTYAGSQTILLRSQEPVELSNSYGTTLSEYFINHNRLRYDAALLHPLAADGELCEYEFSIPASSKAGPLTGGDKIITAKDSSALVVAQPLIELELQNITAAGSSHSPVTRSNVEVTLMPDSSCSTAAPAAVTLGRVGSTTPAPTKTVTLGAQQCGWTLKYQNPVGDCQVSAQQKHSGTAVGSADTDGTLELLTRDGSGTGPAYATTQMLVDEVEFTVSSSCGDVFPATFSVSAVTDTQVGADHTGTVIDVNVAPTSTAHEGCTAAHVVPLSLTTDSMTMATTASVTRNLVAAPSGVSAACSYDVTFEARKSISANLVLQLDSATDSPISAPALPSSPAASVSRSYTAVRATTVKLENATADSQTAHADGDDMAHVVITPPASSSCTASQTAAFSLDPAGGSLATEDVTLGLADCTWEINFNNTNSDCEVSAQAYSDAAGNTTAGSPVLSTASAPGSLTLTVADDVIKLGSDEVALVKFTVATASGKCTTFFDATLQATVSGATAGDHEDVNLPVTLSAGSGCTTLTGFELTFDDNNDAEDMPQLIDTPWGGSQCTYTVTYAALVPASGVSGKALVRQSVTRADVSQTNDTISATYQAETAASVTLHNATLVGQAAHPLAGMANVEVTPPATGGCAAASETAKFTLNAGSGGSKGVALGTTDCTWTIEFNNVGSNCQVSAQLIGTDDTPLDDAPVVSTSSGAGSLSLYVVSGATMSAASSGTEVGSVRFSVATDAANCTTFFLGTIGVEVSDPERANHLGTQLTAEVGSGGTGCSVIGDVVLTLGGNPGAITYESQPINNVVGTPWASSPASSSPCSYPVTFPTRETSMGLGLTDVSLVHQSAAPGPTALSATTRTVTASYQVVREALITLNNATEASHEAHPVTGMSSVVVTPDGSVSNACSEDTVVTLDTGGAKSASVGLGASACTWTINFQNTANNCQVSAQLIGTDDNPLADSPQTSTSSGMGSLTLHVNSDLQVMSAASGGSEVSSVKFTVATAAADCTTYFNATVVVSVTDFDNGNHKGTVITAEFGTSGTGCTTIEDVDLTLGDNIVTATLKSGIINNVIGTPWGGSACSYTVTFPAQRNSEGTGQSNTILRRTSIAPGATLSATVNSITGLYNAIRPAVVTFENVTADPSNDRSDDYVVIIPPASGGCMDASHTSNILLDHIDQGVQDDEDITLGLDDCTWTIEFRHSDSECEVSAQAYGTDGTTTVGSVVRSTPGAPGSLTLRVDSEVIKLAGNNTAIGSVQFTSATDMETPAPPAALTDAKCTTFFDATFHATVDNTQVGDNHTNIRIPVTVTSGSGCTKPTDDDLEMLKLTNNAFQVGYGGWVDLPWGATTRCVYTVTYQRAVSPSGVSGKSLILQTVDRATIDAENDTIRATYEALASAAVTLNNATVSGNAHPETGMSSVVVTPANTSASDACSATTAVTLDTGSNKSQETTLGASNCTWTIEFKNTASDCEVSAQLLQTDNTTPIDSAALSTPSMPGSLTLHVVNSRTMSAASGGTEVGSVKFLVSTATGKCTTYFNATVGVSVTDTESGNHSPTVITATVGAGGTGCSDIDDVVLTLGANTGTTTTESHTENKVIGTPWVSSGSPTPCSYPVTFPPRQASLGTGQSDAALRRTSITPADAMLKDEATNRTITAAYNVTRAATVTLENATVSGNAHPATNMSSVVVTPDSSVSNACSEDTVETLDTGSSKSASVTLGTTNCTWTIKFENQLSNCQVTAQLIGANNSPLPGASQTSTPSMPNAPGSLTLYVVDSQTMSAASSGSEVVSVKFTVATAAANCTTFFNAKVGVTVTDADSDNHSSTPITVTVGAGGAGCTDIADVPLTLGDASGTTTTVESDPTNNVIGTPWGSDTACSYPVTFPALPASTGAGVSGVSLRLTSTNPATPALSATDTTVTAAYTAVRAAIVTVENITADNHAAHPVTGMSSVVVTPTDTSASNACTAKTPVTVAAGSSNSESVALTSSTTACTWKIAFNNTNSDCEVTAQAFGADGTTPVTLTITPSTSSGAGSLTLYANNSLQVLNAASNGTVVGVIKFTVATAAGKCTTFFPGMLDVTVTDTEGDSHSSTVVPVEVTAVGTGCSAFADDVDITLGANSGTTTTKSENLGHLINRPWGGSQDCSYTVEFPDEVTSTGAGLTDIKLELASVTPTGSALSNSVRKLTAAYDVVRPAKVTLKNETSGTFTPSTRANVRLMPGNPNTCLPSDTATIELDKDSADKDIFLSTTKGCAWTIGFRNETNDCQVTAQLKQPDGTEITPANTSGTLTLYTNDSRQTVTARTNGTRVGSVEFTVSTCTTTFDGTLSVTVTDDQSANHNGTTITVPVSSAGAGCSTNIPNATITLVANSGTRTTATAMVRGLIDKPWNQDQCVYTAAFPSPVNSSAGTGSEVQLRTSNTRVEFNGPTGNAKATATAAYTAIRAASLSLSNATSPSSTGHSSASQRSVAITYGSGTCTPDPSTAPTLDPAASQDVTLGTADCTWSLNFNNTASDCVVSAQPKGASGNAGLAVRGVSGSLSFSIDGNSREVSRNGQTVTSVEFTVINDCDISFNGMVSITANDTISQDNHANTAFNVTVSPASGVGCTASRNVTVTLSANGSGSAPVNGLVAKKAGTAACSYSVSFPSSRVSAGNPRILLARTSVTGSPISSTSRTATAAYTAERIPDPPVLVASVSPAGSVTEGNPLVFRAGLLGPAPQLVQLTYTVSGLGDAATTGTATINAGQTATEISIPTDDNDLDQPDRTVRVALTSATGGASIDPLGSTATGVIKDDDPSPAAALKSGTINGNELRFTVELSEKSGFDVRVNYIISVDLKGSVPIPAGQLTGQAVRRINVTELASSGSIRVRLDSAQNANIDFNNRELRVLPSSATWQFHVVTQPGARPSQIAASLGFRAGWSLFSWNTASQRWIKHTDASGGNVVLAVGTAIVFRGDEPSEASLRSAGLGSPDRVTLRQGWNIFTPHPDAVGLSASDFQSTDAGDSTVVFDPRLTDCSINAGVLVIYTYNQNDRGSQNGWRIALPCHPQAQAEAGIPAIETIDANDTIYVWFNSTTSANLAFRDGQYTPA